MFGDDPGPEPLPEPTEADFKRVLAHAPAAPRQLRASFFGSLALLIIVSAAAIPIALLLVEFIPKIPKVDFGWLIFGIPIAGVWVATSRQRRTLKLGQAGVAVVTGARRNSRWGPSVQYRLREPGGGWKEPRWCLFNGTVSVPAVNQVERVYFDPDNESHWVLEPSAFFAIRRPHTRTD